MKLNVLIILVLIFSFISTYGFAQSGTEGLLDLRNWDFQSEGTAELNGEWLMYWEQFIDAGSIESRSLEQLRPEADGTFTMPHTWNSWEYNGNEVGGEGFATFICDVILPAEMQRAALWIPNASTAYSLWANGTLIAQSGEPGTSRKTSIPRYIMRTAQLPAEDGRVRLVLQVSNYYHRRGGMWKSIKLGTPDQISSLDVNETVYDLLLMGSFIAIALFNIFLYQYRKQGISDRPAGYNIGDDEQARRAGTVPLLLALTFFAMAARVLVTGQIMVTRMIPSFPWGLQLRIEYLSAMTVFFLFSRISKSAYPGVIPDFLIYGIMIFVGINAAGVIFLPVRIYSKIITSYNIVKSLVLLIMSVRFIFWSARGHREGWPMVGVILIFLFITLGETLHYREIILSRDFAPVGFVVSLLGTNVHNRTMLYLVTTLLTLGIMLVTFNYFAVRISLSFMRRLTGRPVPQLREKDLQKKLSARELEVMERVAVGKSNKEIAYELFISEGTVKNHLYRIMKKLELGNRTEIAALFSAIQS